MTERSIVSTPRAPSYLNWMAQAVKVENLVFTSGSIPREADGLTIPEGFEEQCRLVLANSEAILNEAGTSFREAIKVTVYLADMDRWEDMNRVYREYIDESRPPARTTVEVSRLNNDYQIEIEAVVLA